MENKLPVSSFADISFLLRFHDNLSKIEVPDLWPWLVWWLSDSVLDDCEVDFKNLYQLSDNLFEK